MKSFNRNVDQECSDFDWAFGLNRISLSVMGVWSLNRSDSAEISARERLRIPYMIIITFFGLLLPQIYALSMVIHNLPLAIDNLLNTCPVVVSCVKLFFVWRNEKILRPVLHTAWKDWLGPRLDWELRIMKKEASRGRLITILDYSIMAGCFCGYVVSPIVGFDIREINNVTDYGGRHFLYQSYYPYDYSVSPWFELSFFLQLLSSLVVVLAVSVPDDYFGALVFHLGAEFRVLGTCIQHLVSDGNRALKHSPRDVNEKFRAYIDRHVHLNTMVSAVESAFRFVIGPQIFCMSIMVCCSGFRIISMLDNDGAGPTPLQLITLTGTLLTLLIHTLVDCFASEVLASHSGDIFFSVYSSKWYLLPREQKRYVVPMMIMSAVPRQIKTGQIIPMSLATYLKIIKSTAGYISVLIAASNR